MPVDLGEGVQAASFILWDACGVDGWLTALDLHRDGFKHHSTPQTTRSTTLWYVATTDGALIPACATVSTERP